MPLTRILYVEDNDDLRESIAMVLESPDRDIAACASAELALPLLEGREWDVLITDVSLPGISGVELARQMMRRKPAQWVVLCSGYDMRAELAALGPNVRALIKPFELDEFEQLLETITAQVHRS